MVNFETPLYLQRTRCIQISKASCLNLREVIGKTSKKKVWETRFNPNKVNLEIKKEFDLLNEMIEYIDKENFEEVVGLLDDSCFKKDRIIKNLTCHKFSCRAKVIEKNSEMIKQRLQIISCILFAYLSSNNYC